MEHDTRSVDAEPLRVRIETAEQRESLSRFLERHGCTPRMVDERCVEIDCAEASAPGPATLVALVEEWRSQQPALHAVLERGDRSAILRHDA